MFDSKNVKHYLLAITLVLIASYVGNNLKIIILMTLNKNMI